MEFHWYQGRIGSMEVVTSNSTANEVENLLSHVLGVVAIDPANVISEDIDPEIVAKLILEKDEMRGQKRTFGVRTKRLAPKGGFKSQEYSAQVGHHMVVNDPSLSVNLREPDVWVRLVLEANRVWLLDERIQEQEDCRLEYREMFFVRSQMKILCCLHSW